MFFIHALSNKVITTFLIIKTKTMSLQEKTKVDFLKNLFILFLTLFWVNGKSQSGKKPNIMFIMADDIGWMQVQAYAMGLTNGETPNIDRLAKEGMKFTNYYAMQSCTSGRTAFITGMYPLRVGLIPPQLPGSPTGLLQGTPDLAKVLLDLGYNTGQFGKNHLGDKDYALPTAHGFQEFFGYLYHLDAMQGASFGDLNISPTEQGVCLPCANTPVKGLAPIPGQVDPKGGVICLTPPRPMLSCTSSDGSLENQSCKDEGPLTLKRSETVDEELSAKVVDYLDRHDPNKTNKPFFVWYNPARMHVTTALSQKYTDMVGVKGGKDWGFNEAGMKQLDDNIGVVFAKLEAMGQMDNTIIVFTTDNGAETMTFPDGGITPFKGQKGDSWEGGYRVPMLIRWPGHIKSGVTTNEMMAALDWMPTLTELAGGPTGDGLKHQIEAGQYKGFVKTTLDGVNQAPFLTGKSEKSARDFFFYYSGAQLAAVRWKNWKFVYYGTGQGATGWLMPLIPYHWTMLTNLNRDPFEQTFSDKSAMSLGGAYNSTVTAYIYDWNLLPIGQRMALEHLETYVAYPPMQAPASYNLSQVMSEIEAQKRAHSTQGTSSE
jgi:arylsulfatase A-like enzyme